MVSYVGENLQPNVLCEGKGGTGGRGGGGRGTNDQDLSVEFYEGGKLEQRNVSHRGRLQLCLR